MHSWDIFWISYIKSIVSNSLYEFYNLLKMLYLNKKIQYQSDAILPSNAISKLQFLKLCVHLI